MPNSPRVFITASSVLAGGIASPESLFRALCEERRPATPLPDNSELGCLAGMEKQDVAILARHQLLALAAVEMAWSSAGLSTSRNRLRGEGGKIRHPTFACVSGSSLGGLCAMESDVAQFGAKKFPPYAVSRWRGNSVAAAAPLRAWRAGFFDQCRLGQWGPDSFSGGFDRGIRNGRFGSSGSGGFRADSLIARSDGAKWKRIPQLRARPIERRPFRHDSGGGRGLPHIGIGRTRNPSRNQTAGGMDWRAVSQ